MKQKFNILLNLWRLFRNIETLRKSNQSVREFGQVAHNILDDCSEEEFYGIDTLSFLYKVVSVPPKEFAKDLKTIKSKYADEVKKK